VTYEQILKDFGGRSYDFEGNNLNVMDFEENYANEQGVGTTAVEMLMAYFILSSEGYQQGMNEVVSKLVDFNIDFNSGFNPSKNPFFGGEINHGDLENPRDLRKEEHQNVNANKNILGMSEVETFWFLAQGIFPNYAPSSSKSSSSKPSSSKSSSSSSNFCFGEDAALRLDHVGYDVLRTHVHQVEFSEADKKSNKLFPVGQTAPNFQKNNNGKELSLQNLAPGRHNNMQESEIFQSQFLQSQMIGESQIGESQIGASQIGQSQMLNQSNLQVSTWNPSQSQEGHFDMFHILSESANPEAITFTVCPHAGRSNMGFNNDISAQMKSIEDKVEERKMQEKQEELVQEQLGQEQLAQQQLAQTPGGPINEQMNINMKQTNKKEEVKGGKKEEEELPLSHFFPGFFDIEFMKIMGKVTESLLTEAKAGFELMKEQEQEENERINNPQLDKSGIGVSAVEQSASFKGPNARNDLPRFDHAETGLNWYRIADTELNGANDVGGLARDKLLSLFGGQIRGAKTLFRIWDLVFQAAFLGSNMNGNAKGDIKGHMKGNVKGNMNGLNMHGNSHPVTVAAVLQAMFIAYVNVGVEETQPKLPGNMSHVSPKLTKQHFDLRQFPEHPLNDNDPLANGKNKDVMVKGGGNVAGAITDKLIAEANRILNIEGFAQTVQKRLDEV
jgi:hypothetical protein